MYQSQELHAYNVIIVAKALHMRLMAGHFNCCANVDVISSSCCVTLERALWETLAGKSDVVCDLWLGKC